MRLQTPKFPESAGFFASVAMLGASAVLSSRSNTTLQIWLFYIGVCGLILSLAWYAVRIFRVLYGARSEQEGQVNNIVGPYAARDNTGSQIVHNAPVFHFHAPTLAPQTAGPSGPIQLVKELEPAGHATKAKGIPQRSPVMLTLTDDFVLTVSPSEFEVCALEAMLALDSGIDPPIRFAVAKLEEVRERLASLGAIVKQSVEQRREIVHLRRYQSNVENAIARLEMAFKVALTKLRECGVTDAPTLGRSLKNVLAECSHRSADRDDQVGFDGVNGDRSFRFYVTRDAARELAERMHVPLKDLTLLYGLDLWDFPSTSFIEDILPRMIARYMHDADNADTTGLATLPPEEYFSLGRWKVGLA